MCSERDIEDVDRETILLILDRVFQIMRENESSPPGFLYAKSTMVHEQSIKNYFKL